jgi:hypothetical protein
MAQKRSRHGLNALKARVSVRGLGAVDRRTVAARALIAWRNELLNDLGGEEAVSSQKRVLVDMATRTKLFVDSLDEWLLRQPGLIQKRKKAVLPVLKERQSLVDSLGRILSQLGLERQAKPAKTLADFLEERETKAELSESEPEAESESETQN